MRNVLAVMILSMATVSAEVGTSMNPGTTIDLPQPARTGEVSIEEVLGQRRSVRAFGSAPLSLQEISQLAWAAQGVSDPRDGLRTTPSAGATFPLEIDLVITGTAGLADGVYRYRPGDHSLELRIAGDRRRELHAAAMGQAAILQAPAVMVISGVVSRTAWRYGARAERYLFMEAGHAAQNVYLQGTALGLGTVVMGAFRDDGVSAVLQLGPGEQPLYIMPLGRMR
jgi:SagB-type dehydrogenase family enzyme